MMRYGMPLIAAATMMLAACSEQAGTVYQQPVDEARRLLAATKLDPSAFGAIVASYAEAETDGASNVVWAVKDRGVEALRFVATLSEAGDTATRVQVEIRGTSPKMTQQLDENATIRKYYLAAIEEQVASALERRPYQMAKVYPEMGVAAVANFGKIMANFDRASEQNKRQTRANIEKAYRDEAARR